MQSAVGQEETVDRHALIIRRVLAIAAATLFVACNSATSPSPSATSSDNPAASGPAASASPNARVPSGELVVALDNLGAQDFRPWLTSSVEDSIWKEMGDTLIEVDPVTRELLPGLAESWSLSDDGTTWDFKLKPNIPFHGDFGTVTAEDVKFSYDQFAFDPDSTRGFIGGAMKQAVDDDMANFEVVGDLEFKLHTTKPVRILDQLLSAREETLVIQSKKYWTEQASTAETHPIGTGPYKFVSSTPGVEVVLEAVPNHWRQTPAFKTLRILAIKEPAARLAQLQSGAVDLAVLTAPLAVEAKASGIKIISVKDVGSVNMILGGMYPGIGDPALGESDTVRSNPLGAARYDRAAPWIQADSPEKGKAIREALSLAIDRQAILDVVMGGEGTLTTAPAIQFPSNPELVDPSWSVPTFDVNAAKAKLAEGGYPDGFPIEMVVYENRAGTGVDSVAEAVAGMWEDIGIKVTRRVSDQTTERPNTQNRTTAGEAWARFTPFFSLPEQALGSTFVPTAGPGMMYDPAITDAVKRLGEATDPEAMWAITREALGHMRDEFAPISLFTANQSWAAGPKVGSWTPLTSSSLLTYVESIQPGQ